VLDTTNSLRVITNLFSQPNESLAFPPWILFALFYQSTMPVAKRWTAQQKLYAIELKRKSPDNKIDDIIVAIRANYDGDVSALTLHA
jgi:hypothetical protein